ncbi:MAG: hypothetical protein KDK37_00645 [Leptospiraceae bacterium]|nr:hypothetical protein [Leptospiraceae bacterium]
MQYGTLRGESVQKCLMQLRNQYGSDVFVIDTREVTEKGLLGTGLFRKKIYEVDFMIKENNAPYHKRKKPPEEKTQHRTAEQAALSFLAGGSGSTGKEEKRGKESFQKPVLARALPSEESPETVEQKSDRLADWPRKSASSAAPASGKSKSQESEKDLPEIDQLIASLKALKEETEKEIPEPHERAESRAQSRKKNTEPVSAGGEGVISTDRLDALLKKMSDAAIADSKEKSRTAKKPATGFAVAEPPSAEEIDALWRDEYIPLSAAQSAHTVEEMPDEAVMSDDELLSLAEKSALPVEASGSQKASDKERNSSDLEKPELEIRTGGWPSSNLLEPGRTIASTDPVARKFLQIRQRLLDSNLSGDLADRIMRSVDDSLSRNDRQEPGRIEEVTLSKLSSMIRMVPDIAPPRGECRAVMLVGPTGSGKTSSIAKLAARYQLRENRELSIYNLDLHRLGATEMLKTYAQIIHAPFYTPFTPDEFRKQLDEDPSEIMLIDTPGIGGQNDRLSKLKEFRDACPVKLDVHLTVAAGTDSRMVDRIFETFDSFGFDKILLTKLDETDFFGAVIEHADKFNRPFSFLMDDPEVRGNIMDARPDDLARMLLD